MRLQCADNTSNTYTQCDNLLSTPFISQLDSTKTAACNSNCFISGVHMSDGQLSYFFCSALSHQQKLANCSWSLYNNNYDIGDTMLPNNSVITELNKHSQFGPMIR